MGVLTGLDPARRQYLMDQARKRAYYAHGATDSHALDLKDQMKANANGFPAATAGPLGLPSDSLYTTQTAANRAAYDTRINNDLQSETRLGLDYGIDFQRNADGSLGSYNISPTVDVSNPFSQAALLKRSYDQSVRGTTNSYAAQGQLYSGALENAQSENAFKNLQQQDSLLKQFRDNFLNIGADRAAAGNELSTSNLDALQTLLGRQAEQAANPIAPAVAAPVAAPAAKTPSREMIERVKARILAEKRKK